MAITDYAAVSNQVQTFWSPMFMKELRQTNVLASLVDKDYQGEIKEGGDTVKVSQINAPDGELLTIGTDADTFSSEQLSESQISIQVNKCAIASYQFTDDSLFLSQIGSQDSEIRAALLHAVNKQVNTYLYSLMVPSASAPDHQLVVTDMNSSAVSNARKLASQAKWPFEMPWYLVLDPSYMTDVQNDTTMASTEYGASDVPVIGGQVALKRYGWNVLEDNSLAEDVGYGFYKDAVHLVMAKEPTFKVSDLHSQHKRGSLISVELIFGAAVGIDGDEKMIKFTGS